MTYDCRYRNRLISSLKWIGRQGSNLRYQDQSLMPYRLATPEKRTAEGRTTDPLPFKPWEAIIPAGDAPTSSLVEDLDIGSPFRLRGDANPVRRLAG